MRPENRSGCLTGLIAGFSRMFLIFAWFARPVAFNVVFGGSWILPCLGIMILPFTTLMRQELDKLKTHYALSHDSLSEAKGLYGKNTRFFAPLRTTLRKVS